MTLRLLADENVDHRVVHRIDHFGHDIEHVDFVPALGKGCSDEAIAQYSEDENRLVLTNDDDFLTGFTDDDYRGLLFIADDSLSGDGIAAIVHAIGETLEAEQLDGVIYVSSNWL